MGSGDVYGTVLRAFDAGIVAPDQEGPDADLASHDRPGRRTSRYGSRLNARAAPS
jgi:hypothetical protein